VTEKGVHKVSEYYCSIHHFFKTMCCDSSNYPTVLNCVDLYGTVVIPPTHTIPISSTHIPQHTTHNTQHFTRQLALETASVLNTNQTSHLLHTPHTHIPHTHHSPLRPGSRQQTCRSEGFPMARRRLLVCPDRRQQSLRCCRHLRHHQHHRNRSLYDGRKENRCYILCLQLILYSENVAVTVSNNEMKIRVIYRGQNNF
jgi:hypothetical protein